VHRHRQGYQAHKWLVHEALRLAGVLQNGALPDALSQWSDATISRVVDTFLAVRFPTVLAANKCDERNATANIAELREAIANVESGAAAGPPGPAATGTATATGTGTAASAAEEEEEEEEAAAAAQAVVPLSARLECELQRLAKEGVLVYEPADTPSEAAGAHGLPPARLVEGGAVPDAVRQLLGARVCLRAAASDATSPFPRQPAAHTHAHTPRAVPQAQPTLATARRFGLLARPSSVDGAPAAEAEAGREAGLEPAAPPLQRHRSTGVREVLGCAMRLRPPTLVWPCVDVQTGLAYPLMPSEPEAGARRTLRDVLVLRPGTTVMDLFEILLVRRMPRVMHTSSALLRGADGAEWPTTLCDALGLPVRTRVRVRACVRACVCWAAWPVEVGGRGLHPSRGARLSWRPNATADQDPGAGRGLLRRAHPHVAQRRQSQALRALGVTTDRVLAARVEPV
jgi:hypothetical protein